MVAEASFGVRLNLLDAAIFLTGWIIGQWVFQGYEAHVVLGKKLAKLIVLAVVFFAIHRWAGRQWFYGLLAVMALSISVLHGYWFHYRNGIHWRTAEPREKYLRLIGK